MSSFRLLVDKLYTLSQSTAESLSVDDLDDVRQYWQTLLGIEESAFDHTIYKDYEVTLHWIDGGLQFHGLQDVVHNRPADVLPNLVESVLGSVGREEVSKGVIEEIEGESDDNDTPDLSQKLTLANKIRSVLDSHAELTRTLSAKSELTKNIVSLYTNDLYYRDATFPVLSSASDLDTTPPPLPIIHAEGPLSSDSELNDIYIYGFTKLLASLGSADNRQTHLRKLRRAATTTVESYLTRKDVRFLFQYETVNSFHRQMWDIVKFAFRQSAEYEDLVSVIDSYSLLNPILPLLKPLYHRLLYEGVEDLDGFEDSQNLVPVQSVQARLLPPSRLADIVEKVVLASDDYVPSLACFSKVITFYAQALEQNGTSLDTDYYYCSVSRAASAWIAQESSAVEFYSDLYALSLVPKSSQHTEDENLVPTVELRESYVKAQRVLGQQRSLLYQWIVSYNDERLFDERYEQILKMQTAPYFYLWMRRSWNGMRGRQKANDLCYSIVYRRIFTLWRQRYEKQSLLDTKEAQFVEAKMFGRWRKFHRRIQNLEEKVEVFEMHNCGHLYFRLLKLQFKARKTSLTTKSDLLLQKNVLSIWHTSADHLEILQQHAVQYNNTTVEEYAFKKWQGRSTGPIKRQAVLETVRRLFVMERVLTLWMEHYNNAVSVRGFQGKWASDQKRILFDQWSHLRHLRSVANQALHKHNLHIAGVYLHQWRSRLDMNEKADLFLRKRLLGSSLHQFRLKLRYVDSCANENFIVAQSVFQQWRLNARLHQCETDRSWNTAGDVLSIWRQRAEVYTEASVRAQELQGGMVLLVYVRFWQKLSAQVHTANTAAEEFAEKWGRVRSARLVAQAMVQWKRKHIKKRQQLVRLSKVYREHCRGVLAVQFAHWKERSVRLARASEAADSFSESSLLGASLAVWIEKYGKTLQLEEMLQNFVSLQDVELLRTLMSRLSLRHIKCQTDYRNADVFRQRWQRNTVKSFFGIWQMKLEQKREAADAVPHTAISNPYIEGSSVSATPTSPFLRRASSRLNSLRSTSSSDLTLIGGSRASSLTFTPATLSPLRTPLRPPQHISISSSAKKARRRNLEQRANQYKLAKQEGEVTPTRRTGLIEPTVSGRRLQSTSNTPLMRRSALLRRGPNDVQ